MAAVGAWYIRVYLPSNSVTSSTGMYFYVGDRHIYADLPNAQEHAPWLVFPLLFIWSPEKFSNPKPRFR
jgi:hypothetical protein